MKKFLAMLAAIVMLSGAGVAATAVDADAANGLKKVSARAANGL